LANSYYILYEKAEIEGASNKLNIEKLIAIYEQLN
jgi:hypothetical protein